MKKNFCKLIAIAAAALMTVSTMAFAENPAVNTEDLTATTVTLAGLPANEEATVLVVKAGTNLEELNNSDIIFIDQITIDSEGDAEFNMDISAAAIADNDQIDAVDVYCGYTSMGDTVLSALNIPVEEEVVVEAPEYDYENSGIYSKAFDLEGYKRVFLKITEPGLWTLTHSNGDSEIYYSVERQGYDCMLVTGAETLEAIVAEITATKVAPAEELTITMYGDLKPSNTFNGQDTAQLKRYLKGLDTTPANMGIKGLLLADLNNNSGINGQDTAQIKRVLKGLDEKVTVAKDVDGPSK